MRPFSCVAVTALALAGCSTPVPTPEPSAKQPVSSVSVPGGSAPPGVASPSASSSAPPSALPAPKAQIALTGTIADTPAAFTGGYARLERGSLVVVLGGTSLECFATPPKDEPRIEFKIPPSRDGRFYTGSTFGVPFEATVQGKWDRFDAGRAMLTVKHADVSSNSPALELDLRLSASGPRFSLSLDGNVRTPICLRPGEVPATIEAPAEPMEIKSAIAHRQPYGLDIWLFPNAVGTCATPQKPNRFEFLVLGELGAKQLGDRAAAGPQPFLPLFHPGAPDDFVTGGSANPIGFGSLSWRQREERVGGTLEADFDVWSPNGQGLMRGTFKATVCR